MESYRLSNKSSKKEGNDQAGQLSPAKVGKRSREEMDKKYRNKLRRDMHDYNKMCIELKILKQELEDSMEREKLKDQWLQQQNKNFEVVQSQVSSMIYNNDIQNQHIRSLFLELLKVSKERDEFRREGKNEVKKKVSKERDEFRREWKNEVKKVSEKLQNSQQQQLLDFSFSDLVSKEKENKLELVHPRGAMSG